MKSKLAGLTLATATLLQAGHSALAGGDVIYTGVKDPYAAAVPVPAPAPIPVYEPEYYVRFDTGASWMADGTIDEVGSGMPVPDLDGSEPIEFGSIGAGRYLTPSIRAELAVELSTVATLDRGSSNFNQVLTSDLGGGSIDTITYDVTRQEKVEFEQDFGMLNFYYDFRNTSRFTPYVGAGIGVSYRQLTRTSSEYAECETLSNNLDPTRDCADNVALPNTSTITEGTSTKKSWDIAGALMAGVAVQVSDSILWDTGYRYMWQNGSLTVDSLTMTGVSRLTVGDIGQHQLRTGIRLNLN